MTSAIGSQASAFIFSKKTPFQAEEVFENLSSQGVNDNFSSSQRRVITNYLEDLVWLGLLWRQGSSYEVRLP